MGVNAQVRGRWGDSGWVGEAAHTAGPQSVFPLISVPLPSPALEPDVCETGASLPGHPVSDLGLRVPS